MTTYKNPLIGSIDVNSREGFFACIDQGAKMFDAIIPGWEKRINLDTLTFVGLNEDDPDAGFDKSTCVMCQATGTLTQDDGLTFLASQGVELWYGWNLLQFGMSWPQTLLGEREITDEWKRQIRLRLQK